jgi:hypothetical protein
VIGLPSLGHGVGLRKEHYRRFVEERPRGVDWLEVITENFLEPGGNPRRVLRAVRRDYPVVMHGVSLAIGGTDPLDDVYLSQVAALAAEIEPAWVSDHLCWGRVDGMNAHDLLPLPFTEESLAHVVERVGRVQERLGRRILLENVSSYVAFACSTLDEAEFLAEVARRADCGILLDVNNVVVSAHNHGFDARAYLAALPAERIGQIHLAGHMRAPDGLRLDTHDRAVPREVWALYREAVARFGRRSTLIEWDAHVPSLERLMAESARAAEHEAAALAEAARAVAPARRARRA